RPRRVREMGPHPWPQFRSAPRSCAQDDPSNLGVIVGSDYRVRRFEVSRRTPTSAPTGSLITWHDWRLLTGGFPELGQRSPSHGASGASEGHGDGLAVDATGAVAGQEHDRVGHFLGGDHSFGWILGLPFAPHVVRRDFASIGLKLCGGFRHLRTYPAWHHGVTRNVVFRYLLRSRPHESRDSMFRHRITGHRLPRVLARRRAHDHDAAPAVRDHVADHLPNELERPLKIHGQLLTPEVVRYFPNCCVLSRAHACIADQDVDRSQTFSGLAYDPLATLWRCHRLD